MNLKSIYKRLAFSGCDLLQKADAEAQWTFEKLSTE